MNFATFSVALIIATVFILIIVNEIKKRRSGKSSCSMGCSGCSMSGICNGKK